MEDEPLTRRDAIVLTAMFAGLFIASLVATAGLVWLAWHFASLVIGWL